jgi:chromosome segregation ATPase
LDKIVEKIQLQDNSDMYIEKIRMYENDIKDLKKIINELDYKININNKKDEEISNLRLLLNDLKKEYARLNESYGLLLSDLKNNVNTNEKLRLLILELENKIETHNNYVGNMDILIKQHIENITRNSLAKKNIDYKSSKDIIDEVKNDNAKLRNKIDDYDFKRLSYSQVLPKYTNLNNSNNFKIDNKSVIDNNSYSIDGNKSFVEISGVEYLNESNPKYENISITTTTN